MVRSFIKTLFSPGPRYSISYALLCIFLSTLIFIPTIHWLLFPETFSLPTTKALPIKNIFLVSSSSSRIPEVIFSETLQLSADHPTYLHQFTTKKAEATLKELGIFSSVSIEKIPDNKGIIIFYSLHSPMGYLGNQENTFINYSGEKFPCLPFFKSQKLPKIFFSTKDLEASILPSWKIDIASLFIEELKEDPPKIIDLSLTEIYPMEITVTLSSGSLLRFQYQTLYNGLKNYHLAQNSTVIDSQQSYIYDLRFPNHLLFSKI
ncbi:hypothetical protein [Chlamydia caviae]|uniref:Cell division protein FtsQ n=1 Tax=Chlamydia caviae (strain ATCC VR-813 / DSM 19441 / 03DC25 / GPIC) TaxID=227941 RepID=Q821S7_CHLCV|nr:hypothetical protein [Chlamydia caviae]AAP05601.1 conserved hypothetical protein [Chlamydia caviae GPIC]